MTANVTRQSEPPASLTETCAYDAVKGPLSINLGSARSIRQAGIGSDAGTGTKASPTTHLPRLTGSILGSDTRSNR